MLEVYKIKLNAKLKLLILVYVLHQIFHSLHTLMHVQFSRTFVNHTLCLIY